MNILHTVITHYIPKVPTSKVHGTNQSHDHGLRRGDKRPQATTSRDQRATHFDLHPHPTRPRLHVRLRPRPTPTHTQTSPSPFHVDDTPSATPTCDLGPATCEPTTKYPTSQNQGVPRSAPIHHSPCRATGIMTSWYVSLRALLVQALAPRSHIYLYTRVDIAATRRDWRWAQRILSAAGPGRDRSSLFEITQPTDPTSPPNPTCLPTQDRAELSN